MEYSNRGRKRGIGEKPTTEGISVRVRVRVREVRRANVVVNRDEGA